MNTNAAVLWSGGKDCSLAHYRAVLAGLDVCCLVTFVPPDARFLAHPIAVMQSQAEALGLPHLVLEVTEPYMDSYRAGIRRLNDDYGIDTLITGDIAEVDGYPNWIRQCCEGTSVSVFTPLWGMSRTEILDDLINNGFDIVFSCIEQSVLSPDWLGKQLNKATFEDLHNLSRENEMDPCGESSSIGLGVSIPLACFIARSISWKEWGKLLRDSLQSMLERNGPFPAFLAIIIVLMFFSLIGSMVVIIKAKDGEIQRLIEHRDSLESMLKERGHRNEWLCCSNILGYCCHGSDISAIPFLVFRKGPKSQSKICTLCSKR